jgi:hypothetical protein
VAVDGAIALAPIGFGIFLHTTQQAPFLSVAAYFPLNLHGRYAPLPIFGQHPFKELDLTSHVIWRVASVLQKNLGQSDGTKYLE